MTRIVLRPMLAALAAILLFAAGCSSDSDDETGVDASAEVDTDGEASADVDAEAGTDTGSDSESPDDFAALFSGDCSQALDELIAAQAEASTAASQAFSGEDPDFTEIRAQLDAMAAAAPDEIKADFQVVAEQFGAFFEALAEVDIDFSSEEPPSEEELAQLENLDSVLDEDALDEATQNIEAYIQDNCS